ncbi:MAG: hypothetical protein ABL958_01305 [Bdellovibrionia bacterium]
MAFHDERSLAASSAFTLAAVVSFITIWFNLQLGNNSRIVESFDRLGKDGPAQARELTGDALRVQSFLALVRPSDWSGDLPRVIISDEKPFAYFTVKDSITMGRRLAAAKGQLSRAMLRSVLALNVPKLDLFHRDLFTDALYFMMEGAFDFADPSSGPARSPSHWLAGIDSLRGLCFSPWKPMELLSVCESMVDSPSISEWDSTISVFSLKPALLSRLAEHLRDISVPARLGFAREWLRSLRDHEWELPAAMTSLAKVPAALDAHLNESFGLKWNGSRDTAVYRISSDEFRARALLLRSSQLEFPLIFEIGEHLYLNHLRVPSRGAFSGDIKVEKMIWQVCETPTLSELSLLKVASNRVLLIRGCGELTSGFRAYFLEGIESFSTADGKAAFFSVFLPSVRLALKWGARPDQALEFGGGEPSRLERLLGFNVPIQGGVIPLVDSFRPEIHGQSVRLSN